jgi:hypothetical protein
MPHEKTRSGRLTWAGVVLCDCDEDSESISDVELARRFEAAQRAACKQLHDVGYLPLVSSGRSRESVSAQDQELWAAVMRHGIE